MVEPAYEVVWPSGRYAQPSMQLAPRLDSLENKIICGLSNGLFYFDETWPLIKELLSKRYPGVKFVDWEKFGTVPNTAKGAEYSALVDKLKEYHCDAVISGRGC